VSNKRALPVAVLLCGVLAGAGWAAVEQTSAATPSTDNRAMTVQTTTTNSVTTTSASTRTSRTTPKPKPSRKKTTPKPSDSKKAGAPPVNAALVQKAVRRVEPNAVVGAVVMDRTSGRTLLSVNAGRRFHSASLVKLLIAIDVLPTETSQDTRDNIAEMLRMSDDTMASRYWVRQGYTDVIHRTAAKLGLHDTAPPSPAGQWGSTWLSPRDMVTIYQYVLGGMSAADRTLIVNAMAGAPEHAADGFDQWFGIPDALTEQWAVKQGWSSSATDICLHSTGLVGPRWRYIVIVLTQHPRSTSFATGTKSTTAGVHALAPLLEG
jgi:hypothetical protein